MAYYIHEQRRNYYVEFGHGRPIVLLHGIGNSGRAWSPQIAPLVAAGFRVIVPDHAGHGASARIDAPLGIADLAGDVVALLDHLEIESATIVGLSLGGLIAIELALAAPTRVDKLVLANSFPSTATDAFRALADQWANTFRSADGPVKRFEGAWPLNVSAAFQASDAGLATWQSWHAIAAMSDGRSLAYIAQGIVGYDASTRLAAIAKPTLVIAGSDDRISPPSIGQAMSAQIRMARFVEIRNAAHISNVDSANVFNEALAAFLTA
ncbi:alpha/beta fold hydrolase [Paraburkholderia pallida]|uniref:Alpha/beta fold hydrolase n=1 Tax=Paraburkholderia pallida TaxID=2547399 RepID=A0A4P7D3X5_9BURK|nr:alpha/beta fold hydrolase [Paraburkholderia pallida]QBR01500.1 alpha/beta fold hydrolase [Paraburkholderia pallida]